MKKIINRFLKKFGYNIRSTNQYTSPSSDEILKNYFIKEEKIIIFDIGAHTGQSAKKYSKFFPNSEIYSFEPFYESFKLLNNLNLENFRAFNFGMSNKEETLTLCINKSSATNSILEFSDSAQDVWGGYEGLKTIDTEICKFTTFDKFCEENSIENIDFLKIDVQGAEYKVLQGAQNLISNNKIKLIQLEVIIGDTYKGQKSVSYYIELFESQGYRVKSFSDFEYINGKLVQTDIFFSL
jgi:FkbM family methyltransferase